MRAIGAMALLKRLAPVVAGVGLAGSGFLRNASAPAGANIVGHNAMAYGLWISNGLVLHGML